MSNQATPLMGKKCRLYPLENAHYDDLYAIFSQHSAVYQFTTLGHTAAHFEQWFKQACVDNAWVICDTADNVVGSSRFYDSDPRVGRTKIGYTWLSPAVIGTGINSEIKYLMLTDAFEQRGMVRVGFDIDSDNHRSRQAVEKIGAVFEGELRLHRRRLDGSLSNTCCYSIIDDEWGEVKSRLETLMATQNSRR